MSNCRPCSVLVRTHVGKGWENWRRLTERVTTVAWDDYTNGSTSFDVSSFLIIRWSSARFAFWETLLHFSPIKTVCFLSANKLEEKNYNNLQYIRHLLLCNDIKLWLYQVRILVKFIYWKWKSKFRFGTACLKSNHLVQHINSRSQSPHSCSFIMIIQALTVCSCHNK